MGYAYRRGIELARGDVVVLSAADVPFGFTDLDAYFAASPRPTIAIGSKGHPQSVVRVPRDRRLVSAVFRAWTRLLLGLKLGDTQGTILLERSLGRELLPRLSCADFLIATEIVCWSRRLGHEPVELPIVYEPAPRPSTVTPLRDGLRMAAGVVRLRGRLRRARNL